MSDSDGFSLILPYLRAIENPIRDPEVSEIMVNPGGRVFVEQDGRLRACPSISIPEESLQAAIRNIARLLGNDVNEAMPLLDARLPDGSRVAATLPPASVGGASLTIRKFQPRKFTGEGLVKADMLTEEQLNWLVEAVETRATILISGGTGTGKTTLLNALCGYIVADERIVLIEDVSEIDIQARNLVRLEARRAIGSMPAITIQELVRQSLRMRPDRLIVGEVRGAEAFDLMQAMNTGHQGTLSTIHSNSARESLSRLRTLVGMAAIALPPETIAEFLGESIDCLVHVERRRGIRQVTEILSVEGYDKGEFLYAR